MNDGRDGRTEFWTKKTGWAPILLQLEGIVGTVFSIGHISSKINWLHPDKQQPRSTITIQMRSYNRV